MYRDISSAFSVHLLLGSAFALFFADCIHQERTAHPIYSATKWVFRAETERTG